MAHPDGPVPGLPTPIDTDGGVGADTLPPSDPLHEVVQDYPTHSLPLKAHPVSFLREMLDEGGTRTAAALQDEAQCPNEERVSIAGMVLVRQRPATARGIIFSKLEDEAGTSNPVVHPKTFERHRAIARHGVLLLVHGEVDRAGEVMHVVVDRFESRNGAAAGMQSGPRDFH
ncbi:MAG: hypothetical protein AAGI22_29015 [Planctomycetota bacterium]